jgi:hypothetical protein
MHIPVSGLYGFSLVSIFSVKQLGAFYHRNNCKISKGDLVMPSFRTYLFMFLDKLVICVTFPLLSVYFYSMGTYSTHFI